MGRYVEGLSDKLRPLNELLRKDNEWVWGPQQESAFKDIKCAIANATTLAFYDPNKPVNISADASSYGIGGVITQEGRQIAFTSRTLAPAETRYAQIEKELLAIIWTCEKFDRYLVGLEKFEVITDLKPLVPIINSKDLDLAPLRCQRMLFRLRRFNLTVRHEPGKNLVIADLLSRKPLSAAASETAEDISAYVHAIISTYPMTDQKMTAIRQASENDDIIRRAMEYTLDGWPRINEVPAKLREYHQVRADLSIADGLLLYGQRIAIPQSMKQDMLQRIHDGHLGINKCRERAKTSVWWPGISADISDTVSKCAHCQVHRGPQRAETLRPRPLPECPWQSDGADLLTYRSQSFLVITDYYSRWFELVRMTSTTSSAVINKMKDIFARWGIPEYFHPHNGPQFTSSEFENFVAEYGFMIDTSSPHFSQANGAAETAVNISKEVLAQDDPFMALLAYRSTPTSVTGFSPSQLIKGRNLRTTLPVTEGTLLPRWPEPQIVADNHDRAKARQAQNYNQQHGAKDLQPLQPGAVVRVRTPHDKLWSPPARVVSQYKPSHDRSYIIDTGESLLRRNRRHLMAVPPAAPPGNPRYHLHHRLLWRLLLPSQWRQRELLWVPYPKLQSDRPVRGNRLSGLKTTTWIKFQY